MEKLSIKTFRNSSYNLVGYVWPIFFSLFITPIIIYKLGIKDYGIFIFVNTIVSLFGLLDLGMAAAVTRYMSNYHGKGDTERLKKLIHTAHTFFLGLGTIGFLFSFWIYLFGADLLPEKFGEYEQYAPLFILGGATFFVSAAISVYNLIPNVLQRFDLSAKIGIASLTTSSLTMLLIVVLGGRLNAIFIAQLILTILFSAATFFIARRILPLATFNLKWDKEEIRRCFKFGSVAFLNNLAGSSLTYLDRLIIPFFVGPSNLTFYSVPGNITTKIPGTSNTLSSVLFPLASQLEGKNDASRIENLYVRSLRLITVVSAALAITTIAFSYKILLYWLGQDFADTSTNILIILSVTNFIIALSSPLSNFLLGLGKLKLLTIISIFTAVINGLLLILLLPRYGITGAAWAYLISVLPIAYTFYYTEKNYLVLIGRKNYYFQKLGSVLVTSLIVWAFDTYFLSRFINSLFTLLICGGVSFITFIIVYRLLHFFDKNDWADIEHFFSLVWKKPQNML